MTKTAKLGEIWLVAIPVLFVKEKNNFDTGFQIRPYLIVDEVKGMLVTENPDYLGLKITTKNNRVKQTYEIKNWKELGLKNKSYIRIEIPQRIEQNQLIGKITELLREQFLKYYRLMLEIFNVAIIEEIMQNEKETSVY